MRRSEASFTGRTGLRRHLTYDRYIQSLRRGLAAVIVVQTIPFLMVFVTSVQSSSWHSLVISSLVLIILLSWTLVVERQHLRSLQGSFLHIDGSEISGKLDQKTVLFSLATIRRVDLVQDRIQGKLCFLVLQGGERLCIQPGLERFDYIIDSIIGYRVDLRTPELAAFRRDTLVNDHLLAHFDSYTRNWPVVICQFVALPTLFLLGLGFETSERVPGITKTMIAASVVIINLATGLYACAAITVWLRARTRKRLEEDPLHLRRDLERERKMDYLGIAIHAALLIAVFVLLR